MLRNRMLLLAALLLSTATTYFAQQTRYAPQGSQIPGPEKPEDQQDWRADISRWRMEKLIRIGYSDKEYRRPELRWTQSSFIQPQMMIEDRYFYDPVKGRYTVDRYLDDLERRYGGIDSVLVWHTYPNIGIDNRSQHDLLRDMPGGLAGVKQMVADFHRRGVRVLFPVMLWDQGTRDFGTPDHEAIARDMAEIGADGINGDTMDFVPRAYREASDRTGHPIVFEPEFLTVDEAVAYNNMGWAYWKYSFIPTISKAKWLESRHLPHVCNRWARNKTDDLQHAFFNGIGYESWENVWSIWNGLTPRDAEALRRISKIERSFAELLISTEWEPHTPTLQYGVYATKFPGSRQSIWTIVNRNDYDLQGRQISIPYSAGVKYYDLWHGTELKPEINAEGQTATLSFETEAKGYGAVLAVRSQDASPTLKTFLAEMNRLSAKRLSDYSGDWKFLPQQIVEIPKTAPASSAPEGMILIPSSSSYDFKVSGIEIEGSNDVGVDVQYPWDDSPRRHHRHQLPVASFYIDRYPVTNAEFKKFIDATKYRPRDTHNFLRDWKNGTFPAGWERKPVTWVSLEDARVYAQWAGKRLPHEWEWQYAAQGSDGRAYPWGNEWIERNVPAPDKRREMREPTNVDAYPQGASPFGVMDLVGNIWQWTDEFQDEHTRAAILRGGSFYQPQGSHWYFPQGYRLDQHGKLLLMAPGKDRAGTLGFRCVKDVGQN